MAENEKDTTEVVEEVIVEEPKKHLENTELSTLQSYHDEEKLRKAVEANFALRNQVLELEKKLLESKLVINGKDARILGLELLQTTDKHNTKRNDHRNFVNSLKEKYELKKKWGFDPTTGEIKED